MIIFFLVFFIMAAGLFVRGFAREVWHEYQHDKWMQQHKSPEHKLRDKQEAQAANRQLWRVLLAYVTFIISISGSVGGYLAMREWTQDRLTARLQSQAAAHTPLPRAVP